MLEKDPPRHLASVPISPRSQRTRASRRGRHRNSTDSKPIVQNGVPDCVLHTRTPVPGDPLVRDRTGDSCEIDFHAPKQGSDPRLKRSMLIAKLASGGEDRARRNVSILVSARCATGRAGAKMPVSGTDAVLPDTPCAERKNEPWR
jgi:hypothetical protein